MSDAPVFWWSLRKSHYGRSRFYRLRHGRDEIARIIPVGQDRYRVLARENGRKAWIGIEGDDLDSLRTQTLAWAKSRVDDLSQDRR